MSKWLYKTLVGGRSGKREIAFLTFFLWCVAFGWAAWREAWGLEVGGTQDLLSATFYPVVGMLAFAHGLEWFSTQSTWKAEEEPLPGGDPTVDHG